MPPQALAARSRLPLPLLLGPLPPCVPLLPLSAWPLSAHRSQSSSCTSCANAAAVALDCRAVCRPCHSVYSLPSAVCCQPSDATKPTCAACCRISFSASSCSRLQQQKRTRMATVDVWLGPGLGALQCVCACLMHSEKWNRGMLGSQRPHLRCMSSSRPRLRSRSCCALKGCRTCGDTPTRNRRTEIS